MKVVFFAPYAIMRPHFEMQLDLAEKHLAQGDDVSFLICHGELPTCDVNHSHDTTKCMRCVGRVGPGTELLQRKVHVEPLARLTPEDRKIMLALPTRFAGIEALKKFEVDGFDIGYAVLSSLASMLKSPHVDLERHEDQLRKLIHASYMTYRSALRFLHANPTDRAYLINGRAGPQRAFFRACQQRGVESQLLEQGCDLRHYSLSVNTLPHDIDARQREAIDHWNQAPEAQRVQQASDWFEERARGKDRTRIAFSKGQQSGLLPENWDPKKRNVAIFSSSEDEFVALGDVWEKSLYKSQVMGLRAMVASLEADPGDLHLYLRIHPRLATCDPRQTQEMLDLERPFLTVIRPDAPVSTYAMMREAEKALSFGSTAGIEAVYWGCPSILAGMSFYRDLGATYNPASHDEVMSLLRSSLAPRDKSAALIYGYYLATWGIPYEHYRPKSYRRGTFKGRVVSPSLTVLARAYTLRAIRFVTRGWQKAG